MLNSYTFLGDVVEIPSTIMFKMSERIFYRFFGFGWFLNFSRIWIVFQIWIDKSKFIHCSSTGRPVFPVTGFAPHNEFVPDAPVVVKLTPTRMRGAERKVRKNGFSIFYRASSLLIFSIKLFCTVRAIVDISATRLNLAPPLPSPKSQQQKGTGAPITQGKKTWSFDF